MEQDNDNNNNSDSSASCQQCEEYKTKIIEMRKRYNSLEQLHYNTRINSGSLHDEINAVTEKDELVALRREFKNLIAINQQLKQELKRDEEDDTCCSIS